ncbi:MAG: MerC domain-containing protein [Pseudomonadota bacterium]
MSSRSTDAMAVGLSGLCLLHCLALPMVVSFSPVFALASEEWVHGVLAVAASIVSLSVMVAGRSGRKSASFISLAALGMALLLAAAFLEPLHDYETLLTVVGASALALAHVMRWRSHA